MSNYGLGHATEHKLRSRSQNKFLRPKSMTKEKDISEARKTRLKNWITFYRLNTHRFIEHYFGVKLHPFQILWIYLMGTKDSVFTVAARSIGKSWLVGLYALARCVLYPESMVVIVSSTMKQAAIIIDEKIKSLNNNYPNIAREIKEISVGINKNEVTFYNGSRIKVVASRDSARGSRATFIIVEESRLVDKEILDSVIIPFTQIRPTPYNLNPAFNHVPAEEAKIFHITSAWYTTEWWWKEALITIRNMIAGKNVAFFATDYLTAIHHRIKTVAQIEKDKDTMDALTFQMEYENIPVGESGNAYYKLKMIQKNRVIKKAFYPIRNDEYGSKKKSESSLPKQDGEIRFVSVDVATRGGKENDLTILSCYRLFPTSKGYEREVVYMESHSGANTIIQASRVKQLYYDFESDYIVLDLQNAGISIFDGLGAITHDAERGIDYPAMTVMAHESVDEITYKELYDRTTGLNAIGVIYPISASARLNSEMAVELRDVLQKRMISFLIDEKDAEEYLIKNFKGFLSAEDSETRANALAPYIQISLFCNEAINLEMTLVSGNIKLVELPGSRKDRFSSILYGNHFASVLEKDLLKETENGEEDWLNSTGFY